jgi:hypothetical protein
VQHQADTRHWLSKLVVAAQRVGRGCVASLTAARSTPRQSGPCAAQHLARGVMGAGGVAQQGQVCTFGRLEAIQRRSGSTPG